MKRPWQFFRCHHLRMAYGLAGLTALFFSYLFMLNGVHHQFTPRWGAYRFLRLFTNQTNLMVVAWSLISCLKVPDEQAGVSLPKGLRGALAAYITLTMVLFHFYLRQCPGALFLFGGLSLIKVDDGCGQECHCHPNSP